MAAVQDLCVKLHCFTKLSLILIARLLFQSTAIKVKQRKGYLQYRQVKKTLHFHLSFFLCVLCQHFKLQLFRILNYVKFNIINVNNDLIISITSQP